MLTVAWSPELPGENGLPSGLKPCALILLSDVVRADAKETLDFFRSQDVQLMVISGDRPGDGFQHRPEGGASRRGSLYRRHGAADGRVH